MRGTRLLLLALCLGGCRKGSSAKHLGASPRAAASVAGGDAVEQPGFDVKVLLSVKARAELLARHETIVVDTSFVAGAKKGTPAKYLGQDGEVIGLGNQRLEVVPGAVARFDHMLQNKDALQWVEGTPALLINVYSGRKSSADNLLDCDVYQGPLSTITDSVLPLHCKLIGE